MPQLNRALSWWLWQTIPVRLSVEGDRATGSDRELRGAPSCSQMTLTGSGGPWATQLRVRDTLATMDMCWGSTEKWGRPERENRFAESGSRFNFQIQPCCLFVSPSAVSCRWTHPPAECSPPRTWSGDLRTERHTGRRPCREAEPSQYCCVHRKVRFKNPIRPWLNSYDHTRLQFWDLLRLSGFFQILNCSTAARSHTCRHTG